MAERKAIDKLIASRRTYKGWVTKSRTRLLNAYTAYTEGEDPALLAEYLEQYKTVLKNTMSKLSKTVSATEKYQKLIILTQIGKNPYLDSADSLRPFGNKDFSWLLTVAPSLSTNSRK